MRQCLFAMSLWLNEKHQQAIALLCDEHLFLTISEWLWTRKGYLELKASFSLVDDELRKDNVRTRAYFILQLVRSAFAMLRWESEALAEMCEKKRKKKHALATLVKVQALRTTVLLALEMVSNSDGSGSWILHSQPEWQSLSRAETSLLRAVFERRTNSAVGGRLPFDLERILSVKRNKSVVADSFLVPRSLQARLLVGLAQLAAPKGDEYSMGSVTLDSPELTDYKTAVSGSGTSLTRLWWRNEHDHAVVLECNLLDEESLEIDREVTMFSGLEELCLSFSSLDDEPKTRGMHHVVMREKKGGFLFYNFFERWLVSVCLLLVACLSGAFSLIRKQRVAPLRWTQMWCVSGQRARGVRCSCVAALAHQCRP